MILMPDQKPLFGELLNLGHWSTDGLIFWSFFREAGKLVDSSFGGNDGVITGATWVGAGLDFNSTGEVNIGTVFNDLPPTYNFSVIIWAKADDIQGDKAVFGNDSVDDIVLYPYDTGGVFRIFWREIGGSVLIGSHSLQGTGFNQFSFVSYASNDHRIYINGILADSSTGTGTVGPFTSDTFIGAFNSGNQNFHGSISDVKIYNRALSASEIQALSINPDLPIWERRPNSSILVPSEEAAVSAGRWGWGWY